MLKGYFLRHAQVLLYSLGQLARTPLATVLTVTVIGITLALPAGLYLVVTNLKQASAGWQTSGQISLFLKPSVSASEGERLAQSYRSRAAVGTAHYLSPQVALEEFKRLSGFGDTLDVLDRNPLPGVIVVTPAAGTAAAPAELELLFEELRGEPEVDAAQLDLDWVRRLHALLSLAERAIWLLTIMLIAAVILVIGNTIRLAVLNRREEIEVIKLVGGTDAFIRRPFLYAGTLQGLLGGALAWSILGAALWVLNTPMADLSRLYGSAFELTGLQPSLIGAIFLGGGALGWLGSRIAVAHHLRLIGRN